MKDEGRMAWVDGYLVRQSEPWGFARSNRFVFHELYIHQPGLGGALMSQPTGAPLFKGVNSTFFRIALIVTSSAILLVGGED